MIELNRYKKLEEEDKAYAERLFKRKNETNKNLHEYEKDRSV